MNMMTKKQSFPRWIIWSLIVAVACIVYGVGISHESFWFDEAYSAMMAGQPFAKIISLIAHDNHPPLYYLILRMFRLLFGNSEWALRLLSVLGAVGLVSLGVGPVRRIAGDTAAFIYAAVALFTPGILIYAHEARMYTVVMFAVSASALYGYLAAQHNRTRDWIVFGVSSLAAAYLHYYGCMATFYVCLFIGLWLLVKKREHLKSFMITVGVVFAGYLPWLMVFVKQTLTMKKASWIIPVDRLAVIKAFHKPFAYKDFFPDKRLTMGIVVILSLTLIIFGVVAALKRKARIELTLSLFALLVYLCTMLTGVIVSLILTPVFMARYMIVCAGLFLIPLSLSISLLSNKKLRVTAVGVFAFFNLFVIKDVYTQHFNGPMKEVAQSLRDAIKPGALIITSDAFAMGPAVYYFPEANHAFFINDTESQWKHIFTPFTPRLHDDDDLKALFSTYQSFWYITSNIGLSKNVWTILQGEKGWEEYLEPITYSTPFSAIGFTASKFTYTGQENARQRGTLNIHLTSLRPVGHLFVVLYDKGPLSRTAPAYRFEAVNITEEELLYTFDGLEYGEYVLVMAHDENDNRIHDFDEKGRRPIEGTFVLNLDASSGLEDFIFDNIKFEFREPEKTIEAKMMYPSSEP